MTGVSLMIPLVIIGGIFLALSYAAASLSNNVQDAFNSTGTVGWLFVQVGVAGLTFTVLMLGAYIAYAIADHPGPAPGFILSYITQQGDVLQAAGDVIGLQGGSAGVGYLGAIVAGSLAGIVTHWFKQRDVSEFITPMMPVFLILIATTAALTPVMLFVLGVPISITNAGLTEFLSNVQGGGQAIPLGGTFGTMMAAGMGGLINKVAYVFSAGLISGGVAIPMAAVMIAGMALLIDLTLSNFIVPQKYAVEMYEGAKSGMLLGSSLIIEGAIPHAAADPARVISSVVAGSAVADAALMTLGVNMPVPHDGIFVVPLSNQLFMLIACIPLGSIVTAAIAVAIKLNFDAKVAA